MESFPDSKFSEKRTFPVPPVTGGVIGGVTTAVTFTATLWVSDVPPVPVQLMLYVVLAVGVTGDVPLVPFVPDHPPLAIQLVALVEDQDRVDD